MSDELKPLLPGIVFIESGTAFAVFRNGNGSGQPWLYRWSPGIREFISVIEFRVLTESGAALYGIKHDPSVLTVVKS